jgi:hypothetical protein
MIMLQYTNFPNTVRIFQVNKMLAPAIFAPIILMMSCGASAASTPLALSAVVDQQSTDNTTATPPSSDASTPDIPEDNSSRSPLDIMVGPEASVFFPTSGKTSNTYGNSWASIGVGLGSAYQANSKGNLSPFFTILYNTHDNNRAFLLPFGIAYNKALSPSASSAYYGVDLLAVAADQRSVINNVHSGFSFAPGARAAFGYEFGKTAYVQAAYMLTSSIKGFNFSGTSLEAGIRF